MPTYATVTGSLTYPDSDQPLYARISAHPQTAGELLALDDRTTLGPAVATTDQSTGEFSLPIPQGAEPVLWRLVVKPLRAERVIAPYTLGVFEIDGDTALHDLVATDVTAVSATTVASLVAYVDGAQAAQAAAEAARDAAVDISNISTPDGVVTAIDADPDSEFRQQADARLLATFARVVQVISDGTDQTAEMNAALAYGSAFGSVRKTVKFVGDFVTTDTLVTWTGTTLDATDATVSLATGTNKNLLVNRSAVTPQRTTTASISSGSTSLTGGSFTSADVGRSITVPDAGNLIYNVGIPPEALLGMTNAPLTATVVSVAGGTATLSKAAGKTVSGATVKIYDRDKDITIRGGSWDYGNNAGGVDDNRRHVMLLRRIDGLTVAPDRMTSTSGKYLIAPGDCTDTDISVRSADGASAIVQLVGPMIRTRIHDVNGTGADDPIAFGTGDYPVYMDVSGDILGLTIENINVNVTTAGSCVHGFVVNDGDDVRGLTISNIGGSTMTGYGVSLEHFSMSAVTLTNIRPVQAVAGPLMQIGTSIDHLVVDGFTVTKGSAVVLNAAAVIGMMCLRNGSFVGSPDSDMVNVFDATVSDLSIDYCRATLTGSAYIAGLKSGSEVKRLRIANSSSYGGGGAFDSPTDTLLGAADLIGLNIDTAAWVGTISGTTTVRMSDVRQPNPQAGSFFLSATARATIYADRCSVSIPAVTSGYTLRLVGTGMPMDVTKVNAPVAGDVMFNTNGSAAPFDGVIVRGPSDWKNLYNGTTG